jgi:methyl halide transferase
MNILDKDYWQQRYENGDTGWDVGTITTPIKEFIDYLVEVKNVDKNIKILIPGAGSGHEAAYLWESGFRNVYVCDWAVDAIQRFRTKVPQFPDNQLIIGDFFEIKETFDMIIEQTFFCAIRPELRPLYAEKVSSLLIENEDENKAYLGVLVGLLFGKEFPFQGPPFGGTEMEYRHFFNLYFKKVEIELAHNSIKPREGAELWVKLKK